MVHAQPAWRVRAPARRGCSSSSTVIKWYPVGADELLDLRADARAGRLDLRIDPGEFALADHERFLADNASSIAEFRTRQSEAFGTERDAWEAAGEFERTVEPDAPVAVADVVVPAGSEGVTAPFVATVFRVDVRPGDLVVEGQVLLALEAMKMEAPLVAPTSGRVSAVSVAPGDQVGPGQVVVIVEPAAVTAAA